MMKRSASANSKGSRLLTAAGLLLAGIAAFRLCGIGIAYQSGPAFYRRLAQAVRPGADMKRGAAPAGDMGSGGAAELSAGGSDRGAEIDFSYLKRINPDIVGWLSFDSGDISYPVLQGADNTEYLYTMADGSKNDAGSIFIDALCGADFEDMHTILYGHNRKDLTMFGRLKLYASDPSYYKENRCFTIDTPEGTFRYEVFAWYEAAEDDAVYQVGFAADQAFAEFTAQMKQRSDYDTGVSVDGSDKIVTLSTCSSAGRRFIVHGKRMRGEKNETGRVKADTGEDAEGYAGRQIKMAHGGADNRGK